MPIIIFPPYINTTTTLVSSDFDVDQYWNNTTQYMQFEGPNGATTTTDLKGTAITLGAGATISTTQFKYGTSSLSMVTAANSYCQWPMAAIGTSDFTMETWVYFKTDPASNGYQIFDGRPTTTNGPYVTLSYLASGGGWIYSTNGVVLISGGTASVGSWMHVAIVRASGTTSIYVNGAKKGSTADSTNYVATTMVMGYNSFNLASNLNGYLDDVRITVGIARYTSDFIPPTKSYPYGSGVDTYFDNIVTLMHFDDTITDITNNVITNVGASTSSSIKKYGTSSFNPATGYVTIPYQSFQPTSGTAFTIEMWVYPTGTHTLGTSIGYGSVSATANIANWVFGLTSINTVQLYYYTGASSTSIATSTTCALNTWSHIAVSVTAANAVTVFINGVSSATGTFATPAANTQDLVLGQLNNIKFPGYIDDLRVTNGVARYTANFTPSTTAFPDKFSDATYDPYYDDVSLLVNGEGSLSTDATGKVTFTTATAGVVTSPRRFGTKALSFNGTTATQLITDSTSIAMNTSNPTFTLECWVYPTTFATSQRLLSHPNFGLLLDTTGKLAYNTNVNRMLSNAAVPLNKWTHFAVSCVAGTTAMFVNGVQQAAFSTAYGNTFGNGTVSIGSQTDGTAPFTGYLDEIRVTKNVARYTTSFTPVKQPYALKSVAMDMTYDPYAKYVIAQMRMEGANAGTTFTDDVGRTVTRVGTPTTSTARSKYGTSSALFNGTTDYLTFPAAASNAFGTGDFTTEMWLYPTARGSVASMFYSQAAATGSTGINCYINPTGFVVAGHHTSQFFTTTTAIPLNQWTHFAICRSGTTLTAYINGVAAGTATNSVNMSDQNIWIGNGTDGAYYFAGYIDDVRITKGVCRYLSGFVPPTAQLPLLTTTEYTARYSARDTYAANVIFQMGFDGVVPTDTTLSNTTGTTTAVTIQTATFVDGGAALFNGSSSILNMTDSTNYAFGTGDFCMEAWIMMPARASGPGPVITMGQNTGDTGPIMIITAAGALALNTWNGTRVSSGSNVIPVGFWTHVAITRENGLVRLFINGVLSGSGTYATNFTDPKCIIGAGGTGSSQYFNGYIDNIRLTKGVARYTTAFTPQIN